ncbi:MAG: polymorphic outer membrane protein [Chloroflexi bacterium OLB14]|nr:MAG: polymorphic outer membrane protein [Chloroflexi bacterium OLB14]
MRDFAGIAVFRRGWVSGNNNVDIPTGVVVRNNTVTGYVQNNVGSNSTGFGIVVEGTKMQVLNNTVNGNEVGIQVQSGHLPYTANTNIDGDQSNLSDNYFGRGNSPIACAKVDANIYSSNGVDDATVGSAASRNQTIFNQTKNTYHCTIQEAINLADAGNTIQVPAGTYTENLTIDKGLTLLGPNSAINPNTGSRVAEAIIQPATSNPDPNTSCSIIAYLSTSNITIKGFTFDGDNPSLTSGVMIGSADVDACELLAGYEGMGNIVVENNILRHSTYSGIDFYNYTVDTATSGNYIRYNLFENIGETTYNWGIGILLYNNFYADVSDNVLNNVRVGIQTGNFYQANPGSTGVINNNQINVWRLGIFHNLWYSAASDMPITNNTITAMDSTGSTKWNGMLISSFQTAVDTTITNNTINIGSITQNPASGYNMWNITTSAPITISGGTVTGGNYGVWVNNFEGYNSNATATTAYVDGVTITNAIDAGIYVLDSPSNTNNATVQAVITNTTISNSGKGVHVANADATAEVRNSTIANSTTEGIYNNSSTLTVNSTTVSASGTNNLNNSAGSVSISNTILANATSMDCTSSNPLVLNSFNLIETNSGCGTPALTSDPLLGSLANNGGSTQTMALSATSPAINAGDNGTCEATDQRGIARPQHTTCDIGAYEYSDTTAPTVSSIIRASTSPTSAASVDFTVTFSESVAGVDVADFSLTTTGVSGASITSVSGSNSSYTVSVNTGSGNGTIRLDVPNSATIADAFSNALSGLPFTGGETYVVVKSPTFADVPETYWAHDWIERLYAAGLTGGCTTSPLNYCPTLPVTRAEMAVFLERGLHGNSFTPPNVPATFGDTTGHWAEDWIEALKADGITGGCGGGNYCPNAPVTRAEMAVFLLRVMHTASYTPPNHAPTFGDSARALG